MRCFVLVVCALAALLLFQSCGYIGPISPPSLHIPVAITNLAAVEAADSIQIQFTLPGQTTDTNTILKFNAVDLRIGPEVTPFDLDKWNAGSTQIPISPEKADAALGESQPLKTSLNVAAWEGKEVAIAARAAQRGNRYSQWSNVVHLRVVAPLDVPEIDPQSSAEGVKLVIAPLREHAKARILRQGPNDPQLIEVGVADSAEYSDATAEYGTKYRYAAAAFEDENKANAVSRQSEIKEITPVDTFPPSVPAGVTVLTSPVSVEISWEPSPQPDTKGYYLFRSVDGGAFARVGNLVTLPTYSDKDVQHGKRYAYQVSAMDVRNNESGRSEAVEARF
jgi:hypothetical protein